LNGLKSHVKSVHTYVLKPVQDIKCILPGSIMVLKQTQGMM